MFNKKNEYKTIECENCGTKYKIRTENIKRFGKGLKYRCELCSECLEGYWNGKNEGKGDTRK